MDPALQTTPPYPLERAFVLKLHRDADLGAGKLRGRLLHVMTDERIDFEGSHDLAHALEALIVTSLPLLHEMWSPASPPTLDELFFPTTAKPRP